MENTNAFTKNIDKKINAGADSIERGLEKTRKGAVGLVDRAGSFGEDALENVQEKIETLKEKGEEYWDQAKSSSEDLLDEVMSQGQKGVKKAKTYIQRKPMQALGIAALAGLVIGFLCAPKSSK